jgi:hypothetical protein
MEELIQQCTDPFELEIIHNARPLRDSESALLFTLRAYYSEIKDDHRTILDFKRLKLQPFWMHPDAPILRMTQFEILDTVFALQWLLLSDVYVQDRDDEWFEEYEMALELARSRVFDLIRNETNKDILNASEYCELYVTEEQKIKRKNETEYDYDSDDEKRTKKRRIQIDESLMEEYMTPPYRVNEAFIMDMDATFKSVDAALCARWVFCSSSTTMQIENSQVDLRALRNRVFREFKEVKETTALDYRRKWIQDLLVVPSYVQIHTRWKPFDKRPSSRSVLVRKNDALSYACVPKSILDIVTPPPSAVELRMNTDAALFYLSQSVPNQDRAGQVWIGTLNWDSPIPEIGIGRLLATQQWIAFYPNGTRAAHTSFSAAFMRLAERGDEKTKEFIRKRLELDVNEPNDVF